MRTSASRFPVASCPGQARRRPGFSLIELVVVCAIIAALVGIVLATVTRARASARQAACLSNLRQIHSAFQMSVLDNGGRLPDPMATGESWETAVRRYLASPKVFLCPADEEIGPSIGSSYDWRDTGDDDSTIAGRLLAEMRSDAVMVFDTLPGWHRRGSMNAVHISGVAEAVDSQAGLDDLMQPPAHGRGRKKPKGKP